MKFKYVRKLIILESILIMIFVCTSIYGFISNDIKLVFWSLILSCYLLTSIIDTINDIIKVNSNLTIWDHLKELINENKEL